MTKINPYYSPEKLGLKIMTLEDEPDYDFDILAVWATEDGRVFVETDSGCSCPSPFEALEAETQEKVLAGMERVGSIEQLERTIAAWNSTDYSRRKPKASQAEVQEVLDFARKYLK